MNACSENFLAYTGRKTQVNFKIRFSLLFPHDGIKKPSDQRPWSKADINTYTMTSQQFWFKSIPRAKLSLFATLLFVYVLSDQNWNEVVVTYA